MSRFIHGGGDLDLDGLPDPESHLDSCFGRMAWYHNTKRLATAHSLGMMPDYMRGLICFNKITGLVKVKGLTASNNHTGEKIKDINPEWDVCQTILSLSELNLSNKLGEVDPINLFGGHFGRISCQINDDRFFSLWTSDDHDYDPKAYFNDQTGLIEFEGLDFNLKPQPQRYSFVKSISTKDERERELWDEFREWRARYKNSTFITDVWEPLEKMREGKLDERNQEGHITEIVSTAIKRHYKLIALFRLVSRYLDDQSWNEACQLDDERLVGLALNPFVIIQARLGEVTGFNGVFPLDMAILNMMLSRWKDYFPEIKERMAKVVEDFCPEAPQIAQFLLERHHGVSVILDARNFCPFQYFDSAEDDPYINAFVGEEGGTDSSGSEDEMIEDD